MVVDRALSPATNTLRAHAGMLSGIQPAICVDNWPDPTYARMGAFPTLADVLQANGFRTAAFTENGYVSSRYFGLGAGFELFVERTGSPGNPHIAGTIEETFARGLGWIERHRDESFFLFLHTYQVHAPYRPSPKYRSLFPSTPGASRARVDSDLYDGEVAETDAAVGQLIDGLYEAGLLDRTLIVVTSDHGEEFGEHGGRYHGAHLHQEILHVPLLFYGPEFLPKAVRRAGPMSLVDLPPTILDLAGIAVPGLHDRTIVRCQHLREGSDAPVAPSSIYSEAVAPKSETYGADEEDWLSPALAVTRWPLRMIRERTATGARYRLYDLDADPRERHRLDRTRRHATCGRRGAAARSRCVRGRLARGLGRAAQGARRHHGAATGRSTDRQRPHRATEGARLCRLRDGGVARRTSNRDERAHGDDVYGERQRHHDVESVRHRQNRRRHRSDDGKEPVHGPTPGDVLVGMIGPERRHRRKSQRHEATEDETERRDARDGDRHPARQRQTERPRKQVLARGQVENGRQHERGEQRCDRSRPGVPSGAGSSSGYRFRVKLQHGHQGDRQRVGGIAEKQRPAFGSARFRRT